MRCFAGALLFVLILAGFAVVPGVVDAQGETTPAASVNTHIPAEARQKKNPVPATEESIDRGGRMFSSQCAMCHGAAGDGSGDLAQRLELAMPDFTSKERQAKYSDGELFYIVTEGHGRMPGEGDRLPANTRWEMINYIRSLSVEP